LARDQREQPFLLIASFSHPHDPWEIGRRYWDLYDPAKIPLPTVPSLPWATADPYSRRLRQMCGAEEVPLAEAQIRTARHAYYAAISYADERIGQVLAAVNDAGLASNTIVIFTADHGEMLGERGLWYKMAFFEPSARVPLIIRVPGAVAGQRVATPVSLLDLVPTLLELAVAGDGDAVDLDGHSLLPELALQRHARPSPVVAEYLAEGVTAPAVMVRQGRYKLVSCDGDPDQLYDLVSDPFELENLAVSLDHEHIHRTLRAEVTRRWDLTELHEEVLTSQRQRRLISRALNRGAHASWDFQPQMDATMRYVRSRADLYEVQRRARLDSPPQPGRGSGRER
jgi:choline-sulfatase